MLYIILLLVIAILLYKKKVAFDENYGEKLVRNKLLKYTRKSKSHLLNNITLYYKDGTTQIDHIFICNKGVFVIETKHYKGWIFGDIKSKQWTQTLYKQKYKFQNPLHQNKKHTDAVAKILDFLPFDAVKSIVVFTGEATLKINKLKNVLYLEELIPYIENISSINISQNRIQFCVGRLECIRLEITSETDIEHQRYLEEKFKDK